MGNLCWAIKVWTKNNRSACIDFYIYKALWLLDNKIKNKAIQTGYYINPAMLNHFLWANKKKAVVLPIFKKSYYIHSYKESEISGIVNLWQKELLVRQENKININLSPKRKV